MELSFDQAYARVAAFLNAPERSEHCLNIHQYLGVLAATQSCPVCVSDVDVGFDVLGDDQAGLDEWFALEGELRPAWVKLSDDTGQALYDEDFDLLSLCSVQEADRAPSSELSAWCGGYLRGYMLSQAEWEEVYKVFDASQEEDVEGLKDEHLSFLGMLASFEDWPQALQDSGDSDGMQEAFPQMVEVAEGAVIQFFRLALEIEDATASNDEPFVRDEVKVGRNDPCPCGSGKKYKKCCLH